MFAPLVHRVTAVFRPKRCPQCGHKVRLTYCDVCGYHLIEQIRDQALYHRWPTCRRPQRSFGQTALSTVRGGPS